MKYIFETKQVYDTLMSWGINEPALTHAILAEKVNISIYILRKIFAQDKHIGDYYSAVKRAQGFAKYKGWDDFYVVRYGKHFNKCFTILFNNHFKDASELYHKAKNDNTSENKTKIINIYEELFRMNEKKIMSEERFLVTVRKFDIDKLITSKEEPVEIKQETTKTFEEVIDQPQPQDSKVKRHQRDVINMVSMNYQTLLNNTFERVAVVNIGDYTTLFSLFNAYTKMIASCLYDLSKVEYFEIVQSNNTKLSFKDSFKVRYINPQESLSYTIYLNKINEDEEVLGSLMSTSEIKDLIGKISGLIADLPSKRINDKEYYLNYQSILDLDISLSESSKSLTIHNHYQNPLQKLHWIITTALQDPDYDFKNDLNLLTSIAKIWYNNNEDDNHLFKLHFSELGYDIIKAYKDYLGIDLVVLENRSGDRFETQVKLNLVRQRMEELFKKSE